MIRDEAPRCRPRHRRRPTFDRVEARLLLANYTVLNTADGGPGSLRQAIADADAHPNDPGARDAIVFAIPGGGVHVIMPGLDLPAITDPVLIDGTTEQTPGGTPAIVIDGTNSGGGDGLTVDAPDTTIQGLVINQFGGSGIVVNPGATGVLIRANYVGTDPTGTIAAGNGGDGVAIFESGAIIGGAHPSDANVLSGNFGEGLSLNESGSVALGNFIGTDPTGTIAVGNQGDGVFLSADGNTVGGAISGAGNVISGNLGNGIRVSSNTNVILGNLIGTSFNAGGITLPASQFTTIPNGASGVSVAAGMSENLIGLPGAGNLIAGNRGSGIVLTGRSNDNGIFGNGIGTTRAVGGGIGVGTANLGNGQSGIRMALSSGNVIGGDSPDVGNVISGNAGTGIQIVGNDTSAPGSPGNIVAGNVVGTSLDGLVALPNGAGGVLVANSLNNTIGGTGAGSGNIISSNRGAGLTLSGAATRGNVVLANRIGTDSARLLAQGNAGDGIDVLDASGNAIGAAGYGNIVSANAGDGVLIAGANATGNVFVGNIVGLSSSGIVLGNTGDGVHVAAVGNTIGGPTAGDRNVISGNQGVGLVVATETIGGTLDLGGQTLIQGNFIGTGLDGKVAGQGNQQDGILILDASDVSAVGNVVSGNRQSGIHVLGNSTRLNLQGNIVGLNVDGTRGVSGNFLNGVTLEGISGNVIGGVGPGAGNVFSGNGAVGLVVSGGSANLIVGNLVGTDPTGMIAERNQGDGIALAGSSNNTVGGANPGTRNVISGNGSNGLNIVAGGMNSIFGNLIGVGLDGTTALANFLNGIVVTGSSANSIGGTIESARNIVSANGLVGITVVGSGASANKIVFNRIGTDATGTLARGNALDGILIDSAPENILAFNLIASNVGDGISIRGGDARGNAIVGNAIGTDLSGQARLGNSQDGILINSAPGTIIGGSNPNTFNLISANGGNGIHILGVGATGSAIQGNFIGTTGSVLANSDLNVGRPGSVAIGNGRNGIELDDGATANLIGGTATGAGNLVSGNLGSGLQLFGGAVGNVILGNRIGTDGGGVRAIGNLGAGVALNDASDNIIGGDTPGAGNVISGNGSNGMTLAGSGATRNQIAGNRIGTDVSGSIALGNASSGIILDNAHGNTIGGPTGGAGNIVAANRTFGIAIINAGASSNVVAGNFVGTGRTGAPGLGNALDGLLVIAAPGNRIGGPGASEGNVFSGNGGNGVRILATPGGVLQGNFIGVDPSGARAIGNAFDGILIDGSTGIVVVGGARPGVISGNALNGIEVSGGSSGLTVASNMIGTDLAGRIALGNALDGLILSNAPRNLIASNVISGNFGDGVHLVAAPGNVVRANRVGTTADGTAAIGNGGDGIALQSSPGNVIGGMNAADGNLASGNGGDGIRVIGPGADGNAIGADTVGTDAGGAVGLGNAGFGVSIEEASRTLVVNTLISANGTAGVQISGASATANRLLGDTIGTDRAGRLALSNGFGVLVNGSGGNAIGGTAPGQGNLISGNTQAGIHLFGRFTSGNTIVGNLIGTDAAGRRAIKIPGATPLQQIGVLINGAPGLDINDNPAPGNTVGGATAGARNVISGDLVGVEINGTDASGNVIRGNLIGPTIDGAAGAGNSVGVFINGSPGNVIGGLAGNLISANSVAGVYLLGNTTTNNLIAGNLIGTTPDGLSGLGNGIGVYAENAPGNTVGGTTAAARNVIAANPTAGVYLLGGQSVGNAVLGNSIGVNAAGTVQIRPRQLYGVLLYNAPNNAIARRGPNANKSAGASIANFREFTGKAVVGNPPGTVTTASVPAGPRGRRRNS